MHERGETNNSTAECRRAVLEFEHQLDIKYKIAEEAVVLQGGSPEDTVAVLTMHDGLNWQINRDKSTIPVDGLDYNYWLSRLKTFFVNGDKYESLIMLPSREDGTLVEFSYDQNNPKKVEAIDEFDALYTIDTSGSECVTIHHYEDLMMLVDIACTSEPFNPIKAQRLVATHESKVFK